MSEADHSQAPAASIGERIRIAREAKGLSLDEVASRTRIPTRHLQHIEQGEWDALPAPTYSVGFTRAYANAVGLNGSALGAELREQLGGVQTKAPAYAPYEAADPARVPPRSLALATALIALMLVVGYFVWRGSAVDEQDPIDLAIAEAASTPTPVSGPAAPRQPAPAAANGPVVLTATQEVWLRIYEAGGAPLITERTLTAGERYEVPATARAPQILTGRPDALRVTVGDTVIPPLGEPERTISDVSLAPADLLARVRGGGAAPAGQPPGR